MTKPTDDEILVRAQEIKAEHGGSLTDAMLAAETELSPKPTLPASFTVEIPVKSRVAKWILDEFGGHPSMSVEDRLGAYLTTVLSRSRVSAMRASEEGAEVGDNGAVTMTRAQFAKKVPSE